jgi:hypothetical protein
VGNLPHAAQLALHGLTPVVWLLLEASSLRLCALFSHAGGSNVRLQVHGCIQLLLSSWLVCSPPAGRCGPGHWCWRRNQQRHQRSPQTPAATGKDGLRGHARGRHRVAGSRAAAAAVLLTTEPWNSWPACRLLMSTDASRCCLRCCWGAGADAGAASGSAAATLTCRRCCLPPLKAWARRLARRLQPIHTPISSESCQMHMRPASANGAGSTYLAAQGATRELHTEGAFPCSGIKPWACYNCCIVRCVHWLHATCTCAPATRWMVFCCNMVNKCAPAALTQVTPSRDEKALICAGKARMYWLLSDFVAGGTSARRRSSFAVFDASLITYIQLLVT